MIKNLEGLVEHIGEELRAQSDVAVVGLSGGTDSTLTAMLAVLAFGKENVYGIHMPYGRIDTEGFNSQSQEVAKALGIKDYYIPVDEVADSVIEAVTHGTEEFITQLNAGNARSRARMTVLYTTAHMLGSKLYPNRVRVLGTGNLSEDYIGYDTKGGDALCDLFPIGELFKSEVYQLIQHIVDTTGAIPQDLAEKIISQPPSAGLWDGQTDEEELGYSYAEMEPAIKFLMDPSKTNYVYDENTRAGEVVKFVNDRHNNNKHKHEAPPVISARQFCD